MSYRRVAVHATKELERQHSRKQRKHRVGSQGPHINVCVAIVGGAYCGELCSQQLCSGTATARLRTRSRYSRLASCIMRATRAVAVGAFHIVWRLVTNSAFFVFWGAYKDTTKMLMGQGRWCGDSISAIVPALSRGGHHTLDGPVPLKIAEEWPMLTDFMSLSVYCAQVESVMVQERRPSRKRISTATTASDRPREFYRLAFDNAGRRQTSRHCSAMVAFLRPTAGSFDGSPTNSGRQSRGPSRSVRWFRH